MIFVTLPVRDLPASRAFYEALGFRVNEHSSDEHTAAVVVDDNIVVKLLTREAFAFPVTGDVGDPAAGPTVVNCLTVRTGPQVDDLVAKALASGGKPWLPAHGRRDDLHRQLRRPGRPRLAAHVDGPAARRQLTGGPPRGAGPTPAGFHRLVDMRSSRHAVSRLPDAWASERWWASSPVRRWFRFGWSQAGWSGGAGDAGRAGHVQGAVGVHAEGPAAGEGLQPVVGAAQSSTGSCTSSRRPRRAGPRGRGRPSRPAARSWGSGSGGRGWSRTAAGRPWARSRRVAAGTPSTGQSQSRPRGCSRAARARAGGPSSAAETVASSRPFAVGDRERQRPALRRRQPERAERGGAGRAGGRR